MMGTSPDIEIRVLNETDAADLWAIRLEALQKESNAFGESAGEHQAISIDSFATRIRAASGNLRLGAFLDGQLVGILHFHRSGRTKTRHRASIHAVYVKEPYRRRGIARALLTEILRIARLQSGVEQIELAVGSEQTAAKRLYESFGFKYYGREKRALKVGDDYVDQDLMVLRLV
jgi:ribosomal protein S18 acetylase RimI-like enzyme